MWRWLNNRLHSSWLIATLCAGFVAGVWVVLYTDAVGSIWGVLVVVPVLVIARRWTVPLLFLASVSFGNWYGSVTYQGQQVAGRLHGSYVVAAGTVREDPSLGGKGELKLQLQTVSLGDHPIDGTIWVSTASRLEILRGDKLVLRGVFEPGFGTFVGIIQRATIDEVIRPVPGDVGRVVRDWFASAVRLGIHEPQASLGIGFLTGQKSALPRDLAEALQIAGLTHIVVASGYNLTILVRLARRLFAKYSKYWSMLASGMMIAGFVAVTGLSPSMTRAGFVASLSLLTWAYGRSIHPLVLLALAAAVTVAWQPSYVWGDLGWQLSFTAFFGVMVLAPLLQRYLFGDKEPGMLRQVLGETVAAHIVTIPIIVAAFGVISHVAIIANLMIVPLVPLAMLLTFVTGIVGLVLPGAAEVVGLPVSWLLTYMTETTTWLAGLPWAQTEWQPASWLLVMYSVGVLGLCWYLKRATSYQLAASNIIA